jgi:hypothetical protein
MIAGLIHRCTLEKRYQKQQIAFTGAAGTIYEGDLLTGVTSGATGYVEVVSTYLVLNNVIGDFKASESATAPSGSVTIVAQYDYANDSGEPEYYWVVDQTNVPCRIYVQGGGSVQQAEHGQYVNVPNKVMLAPDTIINPTDYRLISTVAGFEGTYHLTTPLPRYGPAEVYDHIEYSIQAVPSP